MHVARDNVAKGQYDRLCEVQDGDSSCKRCSRYPARVYKYRWVNDGECRTAYFIMSVDYFCNFKCYKAYMS